MGLRTKFNLVMLVAFVAGLSLAASLSYRFLQDDARDEVLQQAGLMLGAANAISGYTDREIAPLLADAMKRTFLPQSIPFWAAKTNFHTLTQHFNGYEFRQPALNPTNPLDRPTDWQADIIDIFQRDPARKQVVTERDTPDGRVLSLAMPIRVDDQGCLSCHSTPAAAPATMVSLYGPANGFGWKLGAVQGATIVSVPLSIPVARARQTFTLFMGGLAAVFALMTVLLNLLLHVVIIKPVRSISASASEVSLGNMDVPEYIPRGRDEIASLGESFNRMRRSLANAMRMLEE